MTKSGCPIKHETSANTGGCPKKHTDDANSQQLSPDNYIPPLSQNRAPGQKRDLPTERQISSIPRTDSDSSDDQNWVYPSEQQFYNALKRKNYETDERDIASIVHIHNDMNEQCWDEIMRWEKLLHSCDCTQPKLQKFMGRPGDLSPKARFMTFFGLAPQPFDRHDWVIDRCGKPVRYVIDYYHGNDDLPGTAVFHVDVRPALDSFESMIDRCKMFFHNYFGENKPEK